VYGILFDDARKLISERSDEKQQSSAPSLKIENLT